MARKLALGQTIGDRYKLIQELGRGGFGTTFIAEDTKRPGNPHCVVKQLTPQANIDLEIAKRFFESEAKILQNLKHDRIPQLLAYFEENEEFYLVQELIEGDTLTEEFKNVPFSEPQVMKLVRDILEVLVFIQQNNYIHRDIKPSNLIRRTSDKKIVLIDFGAVKEKINTEIISDREKPSVMVGTDGYMPEEQRRGFPCFQSDLYAVGMLAIYGLTGRSPDTLIDRDGKVDWQNYLAKDKQYDRSFLKFLEKMVSPNYRDRYSSASYALDYLDRLMTPTEVKSNLKKQPKQTKLTLFKYLVSLVVISFPLLWLFNLIYQDKFVEYQNKNYGIKIDRPENWKVEEINDVFEKGVVFKSPLENKDDKFQEKVSIIVQDLSSNPQSLAEYTKDNIKYIKQNANPDELEESETDLANRSADRVVYSYRDGEDEFKRMQVWNLKNNRAYVVTYTAEEDKFDRFLKNVEKIIDSFIINR